MSENFKKVEGNLEIGVGFFSTAPSYVQMEINIKRYFVETLKRKYNKTVTKNFGKFLKIDN